MLMNKARGSSFLLQKTQPTKSSSCGHLHLPKQKSFTEEKLSKTYIHQLAIDYGHLQMPQSVQQRLYSETKPDFLGLTEMKTVRSIKKEYPQEATPIIDSIAKTQGSSNSNKQIYRSLATINRKLREIKEFNPEEKRKPKIALRLKEIYAIDNSRCQSQKSLKENKDQLNTTKQKVMNKPIDELSTIENIGTNQSHRNECTGQSFRSSTDRKRVHSRIVKTYVGGSAMRMKIINYPDRSDLLKQKEDLQLQMTKKQKSRR